MSAAVRIGDLKSNGDWPGIVSRFQLVILAGLRSKQLLRGAAPRIVLDPLKKRNTSIALEELKRGLLTFNGPAAVSKSEEVTVV
jgi:DNA-directed RNA polymerase omega subunit